MPLPGGLAAGRACETPPPRGMVNDMSAEPIPQSEPQPLETEIAFFEANRAKFCEFALGKWALVKGAKLYGFFDTEAAAYKEGLELFGDEEMLIHQILPEEFIHQNLALELGLIHGTF
jgi:hypothetical protein